jgi:hypothetical protein
MSGAGVQVILRPRRGGVHATHKQYLGGGKIGDDWVLAGRYRYSSQRRDEKYIAKIEKTLIDKRDSSTDKKFNGTLDDAGDKELDKDQFVRALKQRVREHGHESFYAIGKGTVVHDLLTDYHLFTVEDVLQSYEARTLTGGTTADVFEDIEFDDMEMSRLVVESLLTDDIREKMRIRFDHHDEFLDFHGGVLFQMALDVCNASVSFDIEGAQDKLDGLTLNDFPGENLTDFVATAQKYVKIMQGGYALPIRVGSKLLMKCTKTECEFFNSKAFDFLDRVKMDTSCLIPLP